MTNTGFNVFGNYSDYDTELLQLVKVEYVTDTKSNKNVVGEHQEKQNANEEIVPNSEVENVRGGNKADKNNKRQNSSKRLVNQYSDLPKLVKVEHVKEKKKHQYVSNNNVVEEHQEKQNPNENIFRNSEEKNKEKQHLGQELVNQHSEILKLVKVQYVRSKKIHKQVSNINLNKEHQEKQIGNQKIKRDEDKAEKNKKKQNSGKEIFNEYSDLGELVKVEHLTTENSEIKYVKENKTLENSDDDCIFVSEFKPLQNGSVPPQNSFRKNSSRKTKIKNKSISPRNKTVYYDEDLTFLDKKRHKLEEKEKKISQNIKGPSQQNNDTLPSNSNKKQKGKRSNKNKQTKLVYKHSKTNKYFPKIKKVKPPVVEKKIPLADITPLVHNTFDLVKKFVSDSIDCDKLMPKTSNTERSEGFYKNRLSLLTNQTTLYSIVMGVHQGPNYSVAGSSKDYN